MITRNRPRRWLSALFLSVVLTGSGSLAGPVSAAPFRFNAGPWLDLAMTANSYFPALGQALQAISGPSQLPSTGNKLTFLLVGSDWRPNSGERLDTIMVISLNEATNPNSIRAASIPRDTARIPIPSELGGGTYNGKINGMFTWFKKNSGGSREQGLIKFRKTIEFVMDIKIDYVAYIRFAGFDRLVDEVSGVPVNIPNELRDPKYIDKPGWPTGAKFVTGSQSLKGANTERCYGGYPKPVTNWGPVMDCKRALVYVRSRKGKLVGCCSNNDYKRAARQQRFVFDTIRRVTTGFGENKAGSLLQVANSIPSDVTVVPALSVSDASALYTKLSGSTFVGSVVFAPKTYASRISGTSSNQLKLSAVRALSDSWFDET